MLSMDMVIPRRIVSAIIVLLVLVLAGVSMPLILRWRAVWEAEELLRHPLPPVVTEQAPPETPEGAFLPEVNLPVPFTSQAPRGNWDLPYKEACEEASALMAIRYAFATPLLDAEDADAAIRELARINEQELHFPIDQTAEQVARLILSVEPELKVSLIRSPTVESLQELLSAGRVVIVPAAGRELRNPFFRRPGPRYHMFVLRGYTADGYFITNDPGTRRGENYLYPFARIMEAMGDWNDGNPEEGEKVVIVVEPLHEIEN